MSQLFFHEHEGTVSTTAPHPERGIVCVQFKVDAHRVGAPTVDGVDLSAVAGMTTTPPTCPLCPSFVPSPSDQDDDPSA